mmetsp:Transcript_34279/g.32672  ORF Transcript_34279/g.32672 Transcript_34279/m.32672 type:complete len:200 (-) Transcript_34279:1586-2185(-)
MSLRGVRGLRGSFRAFVVHCVLLLLLLDYSFINIRDFNSIGIYIISIFINGLCVFIHSDIINISNTIIIIRHCISLLTITTLIIITTITIIIIIISSSMTNSSLVILIIAIRHGVFRYYFNIIIIIDSPISFIHYHNIIDSLIIKNIISDIVYNLNILPILRLTDHHNTIIIVTGPCTCVFITIITAIIIIMTAIIIIT